MTHEPLTIRITTDSHGEPIATVVNFPGTHADMYSDDLRMIAASLLEAADTMDAESVQQWTPDPSPLYTGE